MEKVLREAGRRRPSPKRVPLAEVETVLRLFREKYSDFNVKHFHEKLTQEHKITLSYSPPSRGLPALAETIAHDHRT